MSAWLLIKSWAISLGLLEPQSVCQRLRSIRETIHLH